ncbi:MAG: hypothetical protein HY506_02485 [Candidatus Yanofskybacteria bacterium]|nr:hypothetical protein [Candidatus Yanofskybacteria bacterium]
MPIEQPGSKPNLEHDIAAKKENFSPIVFKTVVINEGEEKQVVDIIIEISDKKMSLREYLPGGWTFAEGKGMGADSFRGGGGRVVYNPEALSDWREKFALLHEIGHAYSFEEKPEIINEEKLFRTQLDYGSETPQLSPFEGMLLQRENILAGSVEEYIKIAKNLVRDNPEYQKELFVGFLLLLQEERNASAGALRIYRTLKQNGVDIFPDIPPDELQTHLHTSGLDSYLQSIRIALQRYGIYLEAFEEFMRQKRKDNKKD